MLNDYYKYVIPTYSNKKLVDKSSFRFRVAEEQRKLKDVPVKDIVSLIENILKELNISHETNLVFNLKDNPIRRGFYYNIFKANPGMKDKKDIIWLKFTKSGYLGVVASSTDINFNYDNTSGKILNFLGEKWNEDFIILIPLENMGEDLNRNIVESIIGNYLIEKEIPILDYYSHNL